MFKLFLLYCILIINIYCLPSIFMNCIYFYTYIAIYQYGNKFKLTKSLQNSPKKQFTKIPDKTFDKNFTMKKLKNLYFKNKLHKLNINLNRKSKI